MLGSPSLYRFYPSFVADEYSEKCPIRPIQGSLIRSIHTNELVQTKNGQDKRGSYTRKSIQFTLSSNLIPKAILFVVV